MWTALFAAAFAGLLPRAARADWILTTLPNQASATAVHEKLVRAFGDRIEGVFNVDVASNYWSDRGVVAENEVRMTLDSDVPFSQLRDIVEQAHPYRVPMIITSASTGKDLISSKAPQDKYLMGTVEINDTTLELASSLAKELVEVRFCAYAQVERSGGVEGQHRLILKTTGESREQLVREFGGLEFDWTSIRANAPFLSYIDEHVKIQSAEL
mmetsp:Transcript_585/g.1675  ORF Transcript_585/g.1675 Transcript_585/m.1675 type:complete len:213 (-) Transcript_585:105-743(-)|eukprot:CAMPEP_0179350044 /NCGR_PEP_ID=MMETSP0797-20121207/74552_1 /TAXON_ID=47934 /ORGANISM="Dinophysis acuminata, Strain DAEP01" /LENGTH=212 /DNA_ID=CAMNT_0021064943 /DNA_START=82 /DNA_END=720 /DNA_ORIENTATION=-